MKTTHDPDSKSPNDLLNDLHTLVSEAEKMIGDSLSEPAAEAVASLRERFAAAQDRLACLCAGAKKKVVDGAHYTDHAIRANPYQSLAIAAGAGLLIGVLLGRRGR